MKSGWAVAVTTATAVAAAVFAVGNMLGRATELTPPGTASPTPALDKQPPANSGAGGEGGANRPAAVPVQPAAVVVQPVTGPGRPPLLALAASGPHGSHRTTGADYVALTFDDGPDPQWTPKVLALLREHGVKATFCVIGQLVEAFPELVAEIAEAGHTLCNHSWQHDLGLGSRSRTEIRENLERTNAAIQRAAPGARVSYYRQPGGAWTDRVVEVAAELGMSSLHWTVDPRDWSLPGAPAIAEVVRTGTDEGAIILLHDGGGERRGTVRALSRVLPELAARHRLDALPPGVDPPRRHGLELPLKPSQR